MSDINITGEGVRKELLKPNIFKSTEQDDIHPKVLKALADDISFVNALTLLFIKINESGELPEIWKTAFVAGLFKKSAKTYPRNYSSPHKGRVQPGN